MRLHSRIYSLLIPSFIKFIYEYDSCCVCFIGVTFIFLLPSLRVDQTIGWTVFDSILQIPEFN